MKAEWSELRCKPDADLALIYRHADRLGAESIHHFNYEPWHSHGAVVRVLLPINKNAAHLAIKGQVEAIAFWDSAPDEELFGKQWPAVRDFFEATSRLAVQGIDAATLLKVTHCHLNTHGLDVPDEVNFLRRFLRNRKRMVRHDRRQRIREVF